MKVHEHDSIPATHNKIIAALPDSERALLLSKAEFVRLPRREVLYEPMHQIPAVYFVADGIASLVSVMSDGTGIETATIGREGMVGLALFHNVKSTPEQAIMQVPGAAYRIDGDAFRALLPQLPALSQYLHRFSVVMFALAAQNSACNRKHDVQARCARWLLMVADRLDRPVLDLTHDFVAQMLGVRRASVTESLGELERRNLVETGRGRIKVVDREGLQRVACECYTIIRGTVDRLLDGAPATAPEGGLKSSGFEHSAIGAD